MSGKVVSAPETRPAQCCYNCQHFESVLEETESITLICNLHSPDLFEVFPGDVCPKFKMKL